MIWTRTPATCCSACGSAPLNNRGNVYADVKKAIIACQERLELASLVRDYQDLKRRLGLVEFADQMAIAARLATEVPQVSSALRAAFRVVLLDEYQDTSAAQAIMLRGLFSGRTTERWSRAPGDRGRRSVSGHLRMARGGGEQHPDLRRRLSAYATVDRLSASRSRSTDAAGERSSTSPTCSADRCGPRPAV